MDRYAAVGQKTTTTTSFATALALTAPSSGMRRARTYEFMLSASGAPADNVLNWLVQKCTTAGTGTGVSEVPLDEAAAAASIVAEENHSAEPTYTSALIVFQQSINQRGTFRWVASPGGELVIPAVANDGFGWQVKSPAYVGESEVTSMWAE